MERWPDEATDYGEAKPRVKVTGEFVLSYHAKRQLAAWTCSDNSSHCVCHAMVVQSVCVSCFGAVVGSLLLVATMPSQPTVHQTEPLTHDATFLATPPPPYTLSATEKSVGVPLVCGTIGLPSTNYTRTYYVFLWATPLRWIPL